MDITNFMEWFVGQVVNMFTWAFNLLDSITFSGTSVLRVMITIVILGALLGVVLTLSRDVSVIGQNSERVKEKKERANEKKARAESKRSKK